MPDMTEQQWLASLQKNYARNKQWAKPGPYVTTLSPEQESQFRTWVKENNVPFNPGDKVSDYDMRGFWLALQNKDPIAQTAVNKYDNRIHYPDYWKTPYDLTFSNQSKWATESAPAWKYNGTRLVAPSGEILFDARTQRGG